MDFPGESTQGFLETGESRIAYRIIGAGPPIVLTMGLGGSMHDWDPVFLAALSRSRQVIMYDNRGSGASLPGSGEITIPAMATDLSCLIRSLGLTAVSLFGYSMGTAVSVEYAAREPDRVRDIVLYAPFLDGSAVFKNLEPYVDWNLPEIIRMEALFPGEFLARTPDIFSIFPPPAYPINPELIRSQIDAIRKYTYEPGLPGFIPAPVLLLGGREDLLIPPQMVMALARTFPDGQAIIIPEGGHGMLYQVPDHIAALTLEFLSRNGREDGSC